MQSDNQEFMPCRQTKGSAGYDFYAPHDIELGPDEWVTVNTGVRLQSREPVMMAFTTKLTPEIPEAVCEPYIPVGWFMILAPRSSLGIKYGLKFRNTIPVIDQDYRDYIKVTMKTEVPYTIEKGERFMQGIILPFGVFTNESTPVKQRTGGFGSTGAKE